METESKPEDMSTTIGKLADALAKAQGEIDTAKRASENPFFKSNYADLESVWNACRKALTKNNLAVFQTMSGSPENITVITTLAHISGEWMRGKLTLKPVKNDPQAIGSAITYGRRYSLAAMVGVAPENEDDDGNAASGRNEKKAAPDKSPVAEKPMNAPQHGDTNEIEIVLGEVKTKTGENARGKWTRYYVKGDDGQFYSTFSDTEGKALQNLQGQPVHITFKLEQTAKGESRTVVDVYASDPPVNGQQEQAQYDDNSEKATDSLGDLPF